MKPLLKAENLKVHFPIKKGMFSRTVGYVYAVDGIDFELNQKETLGIVGESGCGKTTAGMAAMYLTPPTGGDVWWKDTKIGSMNNSQLRMLRKKMQIIFQDPYSSLNPRMTVNQIISDPMDIHDTYKGKLRKERLEFLLEKVGISPDQGKKYVHEFSGGQRQRIGIARCLALDPKLVIGDEPVSALDVSIQAQIINLLMDLKKEFELSLIIIAHDLAVVEYICDKIIVMYLGKIIESAPYSQLYNDPKHPYTKALLSAIPVADPLIKKDRIVLQGDVPSPIDPPSGCRFHTRCPERMDVCSKKEPATINFSKTHKAACHLYDDMMQGNT